MPPETLSGCLKSDKCTNTLIIIILLFVHYNVHHQRIYRFAFMSHWWVSLQTINLIGLTWFFISVVFVSLSHLKELLCLTAPRASKAGHSPHNLHQPTSFSMTTEALGFTHSTTALDEGLQTAWFVKPNGTNWMQHSLVSIYTKLCDCKHFFFNLPSRVLLSFLTAGHCWFNVTPLLLISIVLAVFCTEPTSPARERATLNLLLLIPQCLSLDLSWLYNLFVLLLARIVKSQSLLWAPQQF